MDDPDLRKELRLAQQRLRTVLDSAADVVLLIGPGGELLYTSDRAADALGYDPASELEPVLDYVHPEDLPDIAALLARSLAVPGPVRSFDCRVRHADGSWREMEGSGTNLLEDPDVAALVVGLRDVTERRAMERSFLRLHRLNTVLAETNEAALHATDAVGLLRDACRIAVDNGGLAAAWAAVPDGDILLPVASFGFQGRGLRRLRDDWDGPATAVGPVDRARATSAPVVVDDYEVEPPYGGWRDVALHLGLHSSLHLPLVVAGEVVAVLSVYAAQPGFFDDAARTLLERLGGNVAFGLAALEASRRREVSEAALARRTRQQAAVARLGELALAAADPSEVADAAVHAILTGVGSPLGSILELEPGGATFRVVAGAGWRQDFVGSILPVEDALPSAWVLEHRTPLVVEDYATEDRFPRAAGLVDEGVAAGVLVPVEVDGRTWGTVAMHTPTPRGFDPEDVSFLQSVANVLAAAVARHEAFSRLRHQALHDPLTGLPNRILLEDRLEQALERARRADGSDGSVAVAVLDIDGFRLVNDTLGPTAGDDLLRAVAQRLTQTVRPGDTLARLAADEFAVVCDSVCPVAPAEAIRAALLEPIEVAGRPLVVTVSTGTAVTGDRQVTSADVLQRALSALHLAKSEGRGRHRTHDEGLETELAARFDLQADLAHAVERGELELAYQPIVDTGTGAVVGTEALLRWNHPVRGVVGPAEFVPLAEETGLIVPIGAWVLAEACRTTAPWARWAERTGRAFHVSVNVSAVQLQDPALVDHVAACLRRNGMDAATLRLEITESVLFSERDASTSILRSLHDLGVGLVVDDFGTGYSSLGYLQRFPLRALKIDRSFTSKLGDGGEHTSAIVEAITSMAAALDLETVAEGVEDEEQREVLLRLGCSYAQGWLFGRPVAAGDFERVLRASAPSPRRSPTAPRRTPADARGQGVDEGAFRSLLDAVPDLVATFDRELRHVYVNAAAERASGRTRSELLGRTNAEVGMPPANVRQWDAAIRSVFITARPLDIDFRHDGPQGTRWYASRLVPEVVDGRVVSVSAITRDVTDEHVASVGEPLLDARTGVLGRAPFLRLAGDLRHAPGGAFAVVVAAFGTDVPAGAGTALRSVVRAGDVTARWAARELVVLRHPVTADGADALRAAVAGALARFDADVDVLVSSAEAPAPADLLERRTRRRGSPTRAPRASGSGASGGSGRRRASPAVG